ncbi:hypothetical protein DL89DRAFT_270041 [Linderina pennispora]|uniref:Uncharacterized protein n=1 Tax=Linderina pennispora TaxID=61395 RepID=A0A1Y1VZ45_9FUNG|nr:uncharacterized protein DL89DRAFT_270041 [Linderina pennispora]ORX66512.1 hypothetical protein DL89DRAFT_270041 [Linderina pennispora]
MAFFQFTDSDVATIKPRVEYMTSMLKEGHGTAVTYKSLISWKMQKENAHTQDRHTLYSRILADPAVAAYRRALEWYVVTIRRKFEELCYLLPASKIACIKWFLYDYFDYIASDEFSPWNHSDIIDMEECIEALPVRH